MTPQAEIYAALTTSTELLAYVPLERIKGEYPTEQMFGVKSILTFFPRITFVLNDRSHSLFADNEPVLDILQFGIDIWLTDSAVVTYSLNTIKLEVDKIMLSIGYFKTGEEERRQIANKINHLSLAYVKEFPSNL